MPKSSKQQQKSPRAKAEQKLSRPELRKQKKLEEARLARHPTREEVNQQLADLKKELHDSVLQSQQALARGLVANLKQNNEITYKNIEHLAQGQVTIENQYMVVMRFVLRTARELGERFDRFLQRALQTAQENGALTVDALNLSSEYNPVYTYDDVKKEFDLWYDLRERSDFKDYFEAFLNGDLTPESLKALPPPKAPEVAPPPVELAPPAEPEGGNEDQEKIGKLISLDMLDKEKEGALYGGATVFGGEELEKQQGKEASVIRLAKAEDESPQNTTVPTIDTSVH